MKDWNIKDKKDNKIFNLLCQYSESLSKITKKVLMADIIVKITSDSKIHYVFNIRNKKNSFASSLFDIMIVDLNGSLKLTVNYLDDTKSFDVSENQLENMIDDIITSERMSVYINHLIEIDSRNEN